MPEINAAAADDAQLAPASEGLRQSEKLPARVYGVMALTTALTFATLTTGYQLLFTHHLYA